jgi:imidazolonepropionase-like amidohydrolase
MSRATKLCCILFLLLPTGLVRAETLVIDADSLLSGTGTTLEGARLIVREGRIAALGPADEVAAPAGATRLRAAVATPGFIDVQTSAGLSGLRNVAAVLDQDELRDPDQSALRAIDGFDPNDPLLRFLLEHGVTTIQSGPGPLNPIAGQAGIFRTHGSSADEMALRSPSAVVFNLGELPKSAYDDRLGSSTRMGTAALIRQRLAQARRAGGLFGRDDADLGRMVLRDVARGRLPAIFVTHRADDILTALRIGREFGLDTRIAGATEGYLVRAALHRAGVPVYAGPVMERVSTPETENASYENAALLAQAGVPVALRTGYEAYVPKSRILLFEAAVAAVNGLGRQAALHAITLAPAEMLGIAEDYGSLEPGKVADVVLFDGDPFEYTSHVTAVVAAGRIVHQR